MLTESGVMLPAMRGAAARARPAGGRAARIVWTATLVILAVTGAGLLWRGLHAGTAPDAPLPAYQFDQRVGGELTGDLPASFDPSSPEALSAYGPDRLAIPSLGVDAPLVPESADAHGELVIPGDPGTVGRWRDGPGLDAAAGTTLLAGHVSVAGIGDGALRELHRVQPGALVVTTDASGVARWWRVEALLVRSKESLPAFPSDGRRRLAIVTCGGPLLRTAQGNTYRDNIIVYASPATAR